MGKRSDFVRIARDFYSTPISAVLPLLPHLEEGTKFAEPCAGDGRLVKHLESFGHECVLATDIEPQDESVDQLDIFDLQWTSDADMFITNPPWDRKILHPIITHLSDIAPTWLLFDADWVHTKQSAEYMPRLQKIVSIGRVKWIEDSKMTGKDNCAWHLFDVNNKEETKFYGRV